MNKEIIHIEVEVAATKEKTWDFYTNPKHIVKWNFAVEEWQCPTAENNLTVGGTYKARMEAKDGSFGFDFEATYSKINLGNNFTYVIADGREVKVNFSSKGNSTFVTIDFEAETLNPVDLQKAGWSAILNNFKKYTESN